MHLKQIKITNYKSFFETTEFNFEPGFNVLLGANSSGKTSVLEAICFHEFQSTPHRSILNVTEIDTQLVDTPTVELRFATSIEELGKQALPAQDLFVGIGDQMGHFYEQNLDDLTRL